MLFILFFFFSSRRRHTRWPRDWSSDVCSSDLILSRALRILGFQGNGDVDLAVLEHRHAGGTFGHALHREPLDIGRMPPVRRVGLEHDLDPGCVADELVGAGTDRMLFETVVPDLHEVFLGYDDSR